MKADENPTRFLVVAEEYLRKKYQEELLMVVLKLKIYFWPCRRVEAEAVAEDRWCQDSWEALS